MVSIKTCSFGRNSCQRGSAASFARRQMLEVLQGHGQRLLCRHAKAGKTWRMKRSSDFFLRAWVMPESIQIENWSKPCAS